MFHNAHTAKLLLVLLLMFTFTGCSLFRRKAQPAAVPTPMATPTPAETAVDPSDRPSLTITPLKRVGEYRLLIENLPGDVDTVDFELLYLTEGVERGIIGTYYTDDENPEPVYFGTCSSGTCVPDKSPTNGSITIEYETEKYGDVTLRYPFTP